MLSSYTICSARIKIFPIMRSVNQSFIDAYLETAIWSSTNEDGEPLDDDYGVEDIAPETKKQMVADCEAFCEEAGELIEPDMKRAGHDFWLTRNRHGAGFWDGDWEPPADKQLTEMAHAYGSFDLYPGDDGQLHGT